MKRSTLIRRALLISLTMLAAWLLPMFGGITLDASAVSTDYPPQLMNIATKDSSKVLTENGTTDGSSLSVKALGSDLSCSWRFDRVGADSKGTFFKLVNAQSGRLLTPKGYSATSGNSVIMYGSESDKTQHWYVVPVKQDHLGNDLYYKIVNHSDTNLALTQGSSGMTLSAYTGADSQLWLLNADGLQGFAGYCSDDTTGQIKAADIGGLFGEVVEVTTFDDLKKYATSDTPYTIVVTKNLSVTDLNLNGERYMCQAGRIYVHNNKTIIGSYNAHTLFNVQFCTSSKSGVGNNIIIKNFESQHDAESNNNDSIQFYFGSGKNIWADHITFTGHSNYGYAPKTGKVDEDKFMAVCYDADYATVSDCSFGAHKYGVLLGYPADDANTKSKYDNFPRMSLISNKFNDTNTRGPGLMRWGYFHSLNNYVNKFSMAYTVISNCKIFAENCVYENGGNVICDWDQMTYVGYYSETGSTFSNCNRTKQGGDSNSTAQACSWRPASNYSYTSLTAANAKTYCNSYSGCQSSKDNMMYLRFAKKGVPSCAYTEAPSGPSAASFAEGAAFRFKNVNSGLYM
ncbi:MAG TPA: RICIN domain-containing protein, partial [Ruminococcus sp.]|nr:RICIN domain-containing protein [Ruminococcus sp.]